ncbi:hypothetical protein OA505_00010 [Alphaproteobacteria bacterium]|nr:hypothetical protein [Alphaproteobacteria bacterium]
MLELIENNLPLLILIAFLVIFFIWLGWKIRLWWKNFLFMLVRKRGKKGERTSIQLLKKNGYKVLDEQIKLNGYFFIDDELNKFDLRPDLLVEKDGIQYIAEIKTGEVANPSNRDTRRQLHEYSYYSNQDIILLVDPIKKSIKRLSFKKV